MRWFAVFPFVLSLLALVATGNIAQAQDAMRIVEFTSLTARIADHTYNRETLRGLGEVAQLATVSIEARVKSTAMVTTPIEVVAELDPASIRWQIEDVRTGAQTAWKYGFSRFMLPTPPLDAVVRVEGQIRAIEEPKNVFKPYTVRLLRIEIGGVADVEYQAKAIHPTAMVLTKELENVQVPAGQSDLSSYIATLKRKVVESLEAGRIGRAESLMGVLKDLMPVAREVAFGAEGDRALLTTLAIAIGVLVAAAICGWAMWILNKQRSKGNKVNVDANNKLEALWR